MLALWSHEEAELIITTKSNIRIYDTGHRGDCRTESCEQIDSMGWLERAIPSGLRWLSMSQMKPRRTHPTCCADARKA